MFTIFILDGVALQTSHTLITFEEIVTVMIRFVIVLDYERLIYLD